MNEQEAITAILKEFEEKAKIIEGRINAAMLNENLIAVRELRGLLVMWREAYDIVFKHRKI